MTPEQIKQLKTKSKDDLIKIIINLDQKLFRIIKDLFKDINKTDQSLNDFFAKTVEYNDGLEKEKINGT